MLRLTLLGYWRSSAESEWPDAGAFVDPAWDGRTRARVAEHLNSGTVLRVAGGMSWCRFRCSAYGAYGLGSAELTDGTFLWPSGLVHYVTQHDVRLPDEFVSGIGRAPSTISIEKGFEPEDFAIDFEWWRGQHGFGAHMQTFAHPAPRGRLVARTGGAQPSPLVLRILRRQPELLARSLPDLRGAILRGDDLPLVCDVLEAEVEAVRRELEVVGVKTIFEPAGGAV